MSRVYQPYSGCSQSPVHCSREHVLGSPGYDQSQLLRRWLHKDTQANNKTAVFHHESWNTALELSETWKEVEPPRTLQHSAFQAQRTQGFGMVKASKALKGAHSHRPLASPVQRKTGV